MCICKKCINNGKYDECTIMLHPTIKHYIYGDISKCKGYVNKK